MPLRPKINLASVFGDLNAERPVASAARTQRNVFP